MAENQWADWKEFSAKGNGGPPIPGPRRARLGISPRWIPAVILIGICLGWVLAAVYL